MVLNRSESKRAKLKINKVDPLESKRRNATHRTQNLHPSSIMNMLEQMVENGSWKATRGLIKNGRY